MPAIGTLFGEDFFVDELNADIAFARFGENFIQAALRIFFNQQFIYIFVRFQKFQNGVSAFGFQKMSSCRLTRVIFKKKSNALGFAR